MKNPQSKEDKLTWKQKLIHLCINLLELRIQHAELAMEQAQESANSSDKSSAGDKFETSRAMGHLERDMNAKQAAEAIRDLGFIKSIQIDKIYSDVTLGAIAICNGQCFFVSTGLGPHKLNDTEVVFLSQKAPFAVALISKKAGDSFSFNGKDFNITEVF